MNKTIALLKSESIITEEALFKETERLAHIGSWQFNFKSGMGIWSDETYRLLGFKPGEVAPLLESFLKQIHPDDLKQVLMAIEEVEADKDLPSKKIEHRVILNTTNEVRYLLTEIFIERDTTGEMVRAKGFNLDITSKKLAEQKLYQTQSHLFASQRIANVGSWEIDLSDPAGICESPVYWSDETFRIFGLNPNKFKPTVNSFIERVCPDDRNQLLKRFDYSIETGQVYNSEHRIIRPDNSQRIVHERGEIILDRKSGKPLKMIGTVQDITERKQEEEAFHKSEANLRTISDNATTKYILVDRDLKIASFNKGALEGFKKYFDKIMHIGDNMIDFVNDEKKERVLDIYKRVFEGEHFKLEDSYIQKDGNKLWYYMQLLPVFGENNKVLNMIMSLEDITEKKVAELERDKITSDLIQRNNSLEQFSYIISHNLRQPIANILGITNNFISGITPPEEREEAISALDSSVRRLDEVIADLNGILKIRTKSNINKEKVVLTDILNYTKDSLAYLIKKENAIIEANFSEVDEISALKSFVLSIFHNLVLNSIKFRQTSRTPHIKIRSSKINNKILLTVSDNGLGIDLTKNGNQLFGLYRRFHTHVTGKGVGLFMAKNQVEALGGKITVESKVGGGTTFTIELEKKT